MSAYRIAVIGDRESVMGFRALGLDVFPAEADSVREIFNRVVVSQEPTYAIIYLTEELSLGIQAEIGAVRDALTPAVILIPSKNGSLRIGMNALNTAVERAVGSGIL